MDKQHSIAVVDWEDASGEHGPLSIREMSPLRRMRSCGIFVQETDKCVTLAQDYCPEEDDYRELLHIPKVNIIKLKKVRIPK